MPILLEVTARPIAEINMKIDAKARMNILITLAEAIIKFENTKIELNIKDGVAMDLHLKGDYNLTPKATINLDGTTVINGTINAGLKLSVSINGIPLSFFLLTTFKLNGNAKVVSSFHSHLCYKGEIKAGVGMEAIISEKPPSLPEACHALVSIGCGSNPAAKAAKCLSGNRLDVCAKVCTLSVLNFGRDYFSSVLNFGHV